MARLDRQMTVSCGLAIHLRLGAASFIAKTVESSPKARRGRTFTLALTTIVRCRNLEKPQPSSDASFWGFL